MELKISSEDFKQLEEARVTMQVLLKGLDELFDNSASDVHRELLNKILYRCYFVVLNLIVLKNNCVK
jgi:hypothetical protein